MKTCVPESSYWFAHRNLDEKHWGVKANDNGYEHIGYDDYFTIGRKDAGKYEKKGDFDGTNGHSVGNSTCVFRLTGVSR